MTDDGPFVDAKEMAAYWIKRAEAAEQALAEAKTLVEELESDLAYSMETSDKFIKTTTEAVARTERLAGVLRTLVNRLQQMIDSIYGWGNREDEEALADAKAALAEEPKG